MFVSAIDGAKNAGRRSCCCHIISATLFLDTAPSLPYRECVQAFVPERNRSLMQSG